MAAGARSGTEDDLWARGSIRMAHKLLVAAMLIMLTVPGFGQVNRLAHLADRPRPEPRSRDCSDRGHRQPCRPPAHKFRTAFLGKAATAAHFLVTGVITLFANFQGERLMIVTWGRLHLARPHAGIGGAVCRSRRARTRP